MCLYVTQLYIIEEIPSSDPLIGITDWSFVLYERPILGDHPKAHSEKRCGFL